MVVAKIKSKLETRKSELVETLKNKNISLELQHQAFGAIKEIELFVESLEYHNKTISQENPIRLLSAVKGPDTIFDKVISKFNK